MLFCYRGVWSEAGVGVCLASVAIQRERQIVRMTGLPITMLEDRDRGEEWRWRKGDLRGYREVMLECASRRECRMSLWSSAMAIL